MSWKKFIFSENQKLFFCSKLYELSSKTAFYVQKIFYSHKLSLFPPKITLFCFSLPIRTTLNLLSTKEYSCSFNLCSKFLRCKAGTSHRFKSLPAIPGEVTAFRKTGYLMNAGHFHKNTVSTGDLNRGSQGFAPCAFWVLLAQRKKWQPVLPRRKLRGSANLDSAHRSDIFAPQQLKPF